MYKHIVIIICVFIIIYILYNTIEFQTEKNELNSIIEYKLKTKVKDKIDNNNIFNIKEFDEINDNIIIHNKFKQELIKSKLEKEVEDINNLKIQEQKRKELNEKFNKNLENELNNELNNNINNLKNEIKLFNKLLKIDINNLLNDIKKNKLYESEKQELLKELNNEINLLIQKNNKLPTNLTKDIKIKHNYYKELINKKIQLLNKKYKIYNKIFNNY